MKFSTQELLLDPLAGTSHFNFLLTFLLTLTRMTHLLTAVTATQLFRTLVVTGAQLYLSVTVGRLQLHALYIDQGDLAVTSLAGHLRTGGAVPRVTGEGAGVGTATRAGLTAAQLTHLTRLVALGYCVALLGAAVVAAGQRSSTRSLTGERASLVTRNGTHLMFPETGSWYGDLTGWTGQSFLYKRRLRWLLPGTCQLGLERLNEHQVVAGSRTGVFAAGEGQQAGQAAGGTGPGVTAVGLPGGVVAGGRRPAEFFAAWRLGAPLSPTRDDQGGGGAHTHHLDSLWTRVTGTLVTD